MNQPTPEVLLVAESGVSIPLAQRLGLFDHQMERTLHTLRKVRNAFAHTTTVTSLAEAS